MPLLSAGEFDGLPYYTMPFVDGETLRAAIARGELPIGEASSILRDVARALEFAHGKGVAHRDVKPENVLLAGASAVITDFGVAKALSDAVTGGALTSVGIALGTPAYMAPEQAAADPATDVRADIYAFGATAYEMLAGHAPFAGRSTQGVVAAHATEMPQPDRCHSGERRRPLLADLVMRCLEKRPADRPQRAIGDCCARSTLQRSRRRDQRRERCRPASLAARPGSRGIAIIERSLPAASPRRWRLRPSCGGARPVEPHRTAPLARLPSFRSRTRAATPRSTISKTASRITSATR